MSLQENANLVAQIELKTNTYYVTDRTGGVLLDGITYEDTVSSWGDVPHEGNLGNGAFQVGSTPITMNNGEEMSGGGYRYDPTDVWNNYKITIKRYINGTHFRFIDCLDFTKGLIKQYKINQSQITFSVEVKDNRDDQLLPAVVCTDQGDLSDNEAKTTAKYRGQADYLEFTDSSIFSIGELVKITSSGGTSEYARIKSKQTSPGGVNTDVFFYQNTVNAPWDFDFTNTVEKAFRYLPKFFVDKTIPIQIGDLTNTSGGIFGKTITVNNETGNNAILADYITINEFNNLGAWENGLQRYFEAQAVNATIEGDQAEYKLDGNTAKFKVDTTTTLTSTITDSVQGISVIWVADYTKLMWVDQDDLSTIANAQLISVNILVIDNELMLLADKPTSNQIYVERGFNNTTITTHDAGTAIYQSAKYSSKNLLIFTERFMPNSVTNLSFVENRFSTSLFDKDNNEDPNFTNYYNINSTTGNGKVSNVVDEDATKEVKTYQSIIVGDVAGGTGDVDSNDNYIYFDLIFDNIETDFDTIGWYPAATSTQSVNITSPAGDTGILQSFVTVGVVNPSATYTKNILSYSTGDIFRFAGVISSVTGLSSTSFDYYTTINRSDDGFYGGLGYEWYDADYRIDTRFTQSLNYGVSGTNPTFTYITNAASTFSMSTLKALNKKWRFYIENSFLADYRHDGASCVLQSAVGNFGFWIDFFINFAEKVVMGSLMGREINYDVIDIVGNASPDSYGDLCENPVDVCALLLSQELKYLTDANVTGQTEFTDNWQTVHDYIEDSSNYEILSPDSPTPECAMSYGVDDKRVEGWDFVSWVASHFNLQIIKTYAGKIDIINLHEIYNDTPAGNEIKIEDVLFLPQNGNRRITIHQTGTDLIYNDIIVKYKRNNSTDEYQETYTLPDSYTLAKSGDTLATARDNYYNSEKRNLTIESPFIYNKQDAQRLAEWKADDQAEVHFYIDLYIDWMHYSDKNSLSNQYQVGDVIYLNGSSDGITFTSSRKFYIQTVIFGDSGREAQLQIKSVDPVTSF